MTDPRNETDPLPNGWTWEQLDHEFRSHGRQALYYRIAQHEKPPVDEAMEVWLNAKDSWRSHGNHAAVGIIRDALAKARAGK